MRTLKRIQGDYTTEAIQRNVEEFVNLSLPFWIRDGIYLAPRALASGANVINHGLGRVPQGFLVLDINANVNVYKTAQSNLTITLTASGAASSVTLWVF